ncbi:MAG: PIN domain-containing protein [Candidatus Aenigmarchaeota archaeon]|nr:PIN domain-containing protein [Candidatus Aenigmarchaeota archaeon]
MEIVLDTNFLIDLVKFKIDLDAIYQIIPEPHSLSTLNSVLSELSQISKQKTKSGGYAKLALKVIEQNNIKILKFQGSADMLLVQLAKEGMTIATNDTKLRKEIKSLGKKTIYLKAKKYVAIG